MANTATATASVAKNSATAHIGLFPLALQIGGVAPGSQKFDVHLLVNTPDETVTGFGNITQTTNPPLNINTKLEGTFTYMTVMPKNTSVLINAKGYPVINWPAHGGIGPVLMPIVDLQIVLENGWDTGVANYKYQDTNGTWHSVQDAPVKMLS